MASEQSPSSPKVCVNGCGFYGTAATGGLCSKCYRDSLKEKAMKSPEEASIAQTDAVAGDSAVRSSLKFTKSSGDAVSAVCDSSLASTMSPAAASSESAVAGGDVDPCSPRVCSNGCPFYGTAATGGLCSKCYKDLLKKEETKSLEAATAQLTANSVGCDPSSESSTPTAAGPHESGVAVGTGDLSTKGRCASCNKKLGLLKGFPCKCGNCYCASHRYAEQHKCAYDYKAAGRAALVKTNPVVRADKLQKF